VLAGGSSPRFGSDKALHLVDGLPMALRIAEVLRAAGLEPGLVTKQPRGLGLPERYDVDPVDHPLVGVAAALDDGDALVVPCDLVDLRVEQVRALLLAGPPAVAQGQPLFAVLPGAWAGRARALAQAGAAVRALVDGVPEVDLGPLRNLNRPD